MKKIDYKFEQSKSHYNLDRQAAKISALSSENLININF